MYSIRAKLNLWFTLIITVIFAAVFISLRAYQMENLEKTQAANEALIRDYIRADWQSRATTFADMSADMLVRPVYNRDLEAIRDIAAVTMDNHMAVNCFVLNEDGIILSDGRLEDSLLGHPFDLETMRHGPGTLVERVPITIGTHRLGEVVLEFDRAESESSIQAMQVLAQEQYRQTRNASDTRLLIIFVAALAIGLTGAYLLSRGLTKPLDMLARAIAKVSRHEYEFDVPNRSDEIGALGRMLVTMGRDLKETTITKSALQQEVEDRTRDLQEKARELEEANERLMELDKLKSSLLTNVSHELRTPLTSVLGFARMLAKDARRIADEAQTPAARKQLQRIADNEEIIHKESQRLIRLINNILDLARIESNNLAWDDEPVDIADQLRLALRNVSPVLDRYPDIQVCLNIHPDQRPVLHLDPDRLHQVLLNLLSNAIKYTEAGNILLELAELGDRVEITVADSGPGVPASEQDRIFERFYQSNDDVLIDKPDGTGLGLSICREIITHYGGTITVSSNDWGGATFRITLPTNHTPQAA